MVKHDLAKYLRRSLLLISPDCADVCSMARLSQAIDFPETERLDVRFVIPGEVVTRLQQTEEEIAKRIVETLPDACRKKFASIELGGNGEILFGYSGSWLKRALGKIVDSGQQYGRSDIGQQRKVGIDCFAPSIVEPLGLSDARPVWLGAAISAVLASQGYKLRREWFIHDTDPRLDHLADSVMRRYWQTQGLPVDYPDRFMPGAYVQDLAAELELGGAMLKDVNLLRQQIRREVIEGMIGKISLSAREDLHTSFHVMFRESWLVDRGDCQECLIRLESAGHREGGAPAQPALLLESGDGGPVAFESEGRPTSAGYELTYWYERWYQRKFDWLICVSSINRNPRAEDLRVWLSQFFPDNKASLISPLDVRLRVSNPDEVLTDHQRLQEMLSRLGHDAARFIILSYPADQPVDLNWQVGGSAPESGYKALQYAYEQMCSILQRKEVRYAKPGMTQSSLEHPAERELISRLVAYPDLLQEISQTFEIWRLPLYLSRLAEAYEEWARLCPLFGEQGLDPLRLDVMKATRLVTGLGAKLLGLGHEEETQINTN